MYPDVRQSATSHGKQALMYQDVRQQALFGTTPTRDTVAGDA